MVRRGDGTSIQGEGERHGPWIRSGDAAEGQGFKWQKVSPQLGLDQITGVYREGEGVETLTTQRQT